jgi:predicted HTH domain antitoxin
MNTLTLEVPISSDLLLALGSSPARAVEQVKEFSVLGLYHERRVSAGKAAELLGLTKAEFVRLLARKGHPYLDYTAEELASEIEAVNNWERTRGDA